jgi:glucose/arabinose dehydrogenase
LKSAEFCDDTVGSKINLQAHSSPMGLVFIPEEGWPEGWGNDLLVAYHGSWNRTEPTGYKLMYIDLDDTVNRELLGRQEFITGWLKDDGTVVGRPVDLLIQPGGTLFITDDYRGAVYRVTSI